jgi:hypothetical protein
MTIAAEITPIALAIALILPWLSGAIAVRALVGPAPISLLLGHGFMLGQLLIVLLLLAWDFAGLHLAFTPIALTLAALSGGVLLLYKPQVIWQKPHCSGRWSDILWLLPLIVFLGERGFTLTEELVLRPLFAWDAWMNWAPRSVVWFHHEALTPFVLPEQWLAAPSESVAYTLGNPRANLYPPGVPLLLLWPMLAAGTHDHTLLYLPWLLLPFAASAALWGHLRQQHLPAPICALAVFAFLSQPLVNTHTALPGYADLWLAVAFGLGGMALAQWQASGNGRWGLLAGALALCCALFKVPGIGFALLLVAAGGLLVLRPPARWLIYAGGAAFTLLIGGLLLGLHPHSAQFAANHLVLNLPGPLPTLRLAPAPLLPLLWDSLFVFANWHLFWLLLAACLSTGLVLRGVESLQHVALPVFIAGFCLLLALFGLTHYFAQAVNGVTFDRTLLYVVPLGVYVAFAQLALLWQSEPPAETP